MTNEEEDAEFLAHYGVKGMKWGDAARNAQAVIERNAALAKQGLDAAGNAIGSAAGAAVDEAQRVIAEEHDARLHKDKAKRQAEYEKENFWKKGKDGKLVRDMPALRKHNSAIQAEDKAKDRRKAIAKAQPERDRKDAIKNGGNDKYGPDGTKRGFFDSERKISVARKGGWDTISKTKTQGKAGRFIDSFFDKSVTRRIPKKGNVATVEKGRINKFLAKNFSTESTTSSSSWTTDSKTSTGSSGRVVQKDYQFDRKSPRLKLTRKSKDTNWEKYKN